MSCRKNKPVVKGLMIAMSRAEVCRQFGVTFNTAVYKVCHLRFLSSEVSAMPSPSSGHEFHSCFCFFIKVGLYQTTIRSWPGLKVQTSQGQKANFHWRGDQLIPTSSHEAKSLLIPSNIQPVFHQRWSMCACVQRKDDGNSSCWWSSFIGPNSPPLLCPLLFFSSSLSYPAPCPFLSLLLLLRHPHSLPAVAADRLVLCFGLLIDSMSFSSIRLPQSTCCRLLLC